MSGFWQGAWTGWRLAFSLLVFPGFLFSVVIGFVLSWVDRVVTARVQYRKGPPFVQPFADLFKLLLKQTIVPEGASRLVFLLAPMLGMISMTITAVLLFNVNLNPQGSFVGDLIVLVYLFALPPLGLIIGASASRNPLSAVGASREMTLYFGYELPFLLALVVPIIKTAQVSGGIWTIRLGHIVMAQQQAGPFLYSVSGVIAAVLVLLAVQAKLGLVPFDQAEAEQEIMTGVYAEYSGVALAMFKITRAMMLFLLPLFLITVLWGGFGDWWAILKFLAIVVLVILIRNTNPRLRIDHALRFFWLLLGGFGILAVILAYARL
ncbi:NADH-quinone oxidoreductase subunit H [candidate division WOR-3 bacterium]|nr:NADH-quinone oxidoreductase subunit H [candidate division WOR-3 bacterium]